MPSLPTTLTLGNLEVPVPVVLAPMAGVTNVAFRELCAEQGAGLYVCEMITSRGLVEGTRALDLADVFCRDARRRIEVLFRQLFRNDDTVNYRMALQVLDGVHAWVEQGILDLSDRESNDADADTDRAVDVTDARAAAASG